MTTDITKYQRLYWTPASRWRLFRMWEAVIDLWTPWVKK